jgi:Bacteriophage tail sheath protein
LRVRKVFVLLGGVGNRMPSTVTFPGVFIDEVSGGHPIEGVPTSTTAFVGWARKGPRHKPTKIVSFADYERIFGGLWRFSAMSYAVRHFFLNGGSEALIVRVASAKTRDGLSRDLEEATKVLNGDAKKMTGLQSLKKAGRFNLLCIPPLLLGSSTGTAREADVPRSTWRAAARLCRDRRGFLLIDAPRTWTAVTAVSRVEAFRTIARENGAIYFPRLRLADPLQRNELANFAPSGSVAGIISRIDAVRGVWKAPAGLEASASGVTGLSIAVTDAENEALNPLGINCLRSFAGSAAVVVWGARTLAGTDTSITEWKYIPVRRTTLYIEESLDRGTQWVVFEPNGESLWAQIRLNVGAFMDKLFRQGAFQGRTPNEAYFVKCDQTTTTQDDINAGVVNILVGFAPLKRAEFVVIKLQQLAGQAAN